MTKSRVKSAKIVKPSYSYKKHEGTPAPGQYDGHLQPFGSNMKGVTMGSKYEFKPDSNPPVGYYDVDRGLNMTKF